MTRSTIQLIARVASRGTDLVLDYEHQTFSSDTNGRPTPATGWLSVSPMSLP